MLLDVSRLILYSLPLIDPRSVKHSLSPSFETAVHHFPFLSFCFSSGRTRRKSKRARNDILFGTHLGHISLPPPISQLPYHRYKDATETRSTTQNPIQMQAGQICPPRTSEGGGERNKMPRPIFAGIFLSTALSSDKWPFYPPLFLFLPTTHQCGRGEAAGKGEY